MSFIIFDYLCKECGAIEADKMVRRSEMDSVPCPRCPGQMTRLPAGPTTSFKFNDRSAIKSKKAVSLRDPNYGASSKGHSASLD